MKTMERIQFLNNIAQRLPKDLLYDFYFEVFSGHIAHFEDGRLEEVSSSRSRGIGTRLIKNDNSVFSYAPSTSLTAALSCLSETVCSSGMDAKGFLGSSSDDSEILSTPGSLQYPDYSYIYKIDQLIRKRSPLVKQVSIRQDTSRKNILILKDDGMIIKDTRFYSTFTVQVIVQKEKTIQTAHESLAFSLPMDDFFSKTDPETAAKTALERALLMIEAPECPAGEMPVILSGEAGGTMIHEACGHGLEADIIQKDFSVYRNSIGKKVASENVTLIDDGTIPSFYGTLNVDDEGTDSQRTILIEKGILKNYLTDRITSRQGNLPLSGNGRRSSYRSVPIPRMTNTFVAPGNSSQADMISKTGKGLLVKKMGGGEVNPTSGDFVFQVTEGYLIENGQIRYPVRGALLTGNGPKVLEDIQSVGNDLSFMPGVCGKSGQNIPVTDGQPSLYIKNLIVGGKETEYEAL